MKCDTCKFQNIGTDQETGYIDGHCTKGHWSGIGPVDEHDDGTYFDNCVDFIKKELGQ